jgi:uncharacterized membrane protein YebE (DUF533 family)
MFDSRDLLGAMLGSGMGGRNPRMAGLGYGGGGGMPGGGGLGGLGSILGGASGGGGLGGMMGGGTRAGGMGGMQGALLGVLGGLAVSALQRRMREGASGSPAAGIDNDTALSSRETTRPTTAPSVPDATEAGSITPEHPGHVDEGRAQLLVRVMVAAANADMRIDDQERARILAKLEESGADQEAKSFVEREMRSPMSIDDIAGEVSGPDVAAQVYATALAAIDVDKAMERSFLASLAQRLGLDAEIVGEIHDQLGQPRPA